MLFNSYEFLIFLPIVLLIYYIFPKKFRYFWLLISSYYFYMCWNPKYVLLLLCSTVITYLCGIFLEQSGNGNTGRKKWIVFLGVVSNLLILFFFKYYNFFADNLEIVLQHLHIYRNPKRFDIVLPVGISFYTFQCLGYVVDVYRGDIKAEKNPLKYALFVSFFPQLVAGPIERSKNLLKELSKEVYLRYDNVREGLYLLVYGYFLKLVIADRAAIFVDTVFSDITAYTGAYLIVAVILFSIQIYCDFYGYSVIAKGCARLLGIELMENFDAPYFSRTITEFWQRWHISLSSWFRDYLYIPLGGNRKGTMRQYVNIAIVFLVSGLWHGAAWTFVIWGVLHGLYQIAGRSTKRIREASMKLLEIDNSAFSHKLLQIAGTYFLTAFAWIFFRAESVSQAVKIIKSIFTVYNPWIFLDGSLFQCGLSDKNFRLLVYAILILLFADYLKCKKINIRKKIMQQGIWFRYAVLIFGIIFILVFGIWGSGYDNAGFIYFQF
ncbi:MAG: MBOAT family protein [Lachnospiraceae bacterium]|nr:MBOAT family protein [Lachnospiraceae bacterium]